MPGKKWTEEEKEILLELAKCGYSMNEIATRIGRCKGSVRKKLVELYPPGESWPGRREKLNTLCWGCAKALGGCRWSRSFLPVPGWTAKKTHIENQRKRMDSYHVKSCPEYEEDGYDAF